MPRAAKDPVTGLTEQQERFSYEYAVSGRRSQAYRMAYDCKGSNDETVRKRAGELLENGAIAGRIAYWRSIADAKLAVTVERIALETARLAFFDMRELVDDDGNPIPLQDLPEDTARALNGMDIEELFEGKGKDRKLIGYVKKYKHVPKVEALRLLAQWKNMLVDRHEVGRIGDFDQKLRVMSEAEFAAEEKAAMIELVKGGHLAIAHKKKSSQKGA